MIRMDKSTGQKRVKLEIDRSAMYVYSSFKIFTQHLYDLTILSQDKTIKYIYVEYVYPLHVENIHRYLSKSEKLFSR